MLRQLQSLLFPSRSSKPSPSTEEQKLKVLLVHQNMNLTPEQRESLFAHIQDAVHSFVHNELLETAPQLEVLEEKHKKLAK